MPRKPRAVPSPRSEEDECGGADLLLSLAATAQAMSDGPSAPEEPSSWSATPRALETPTTTGSSPSSNTASGAVTSEFPQQHTTAYAMMYPMYPHHHPYYLYPPMYHPAYYAGVPYPSPATTAGTCAPTSTATTTTTTGPEKKHHRHPNTAGTSKHKHEPRNSSSGTKRVISPANSVEDELREGPSQAFKRQSTQPPQSTTTAATTTKTTTNTSKDPDSDPDDVEGYFTPEDASPATTRAPSVVQTNQHPPPFPPPPAYFSFISHPSHAAAHMTPMQAAQHLPFSQPHNTSPDRTEESPAASRSSSSSSCIQSSEEENNHEEDTVHPTSPFSPQKRRRLLPLRCVKTTRTSPPTTNSSSSSTTTTTVTLPDFREIVNFPAYVTQSKASGGGAVERPCVMCGVLRLDAQRLKKHGRNSVSRRKGTQSKTTTTTSTTSTTNMQDIIPAQNKGVCTACDVAVWTFQDMDIKWCKGCKNFKLWSDFGRKLKGTKCVKCRSRQHDAYAKQKGQPSHLQQTYTQDRLETEEDAARVIDALRSLGSSRG